MDDLYATVRNIAEHVKIPGLRDDQVYLGENYLHSKEDWALKLQRADSVFTWVAYSFGDIPMWELHAGAVLVDDSAYVGIHCHKDTKPEYIQVVHDMGGKFGQFNDSVSACEFQYNKVFAGCGERDISNIGKTLSDIYTAVRANMRQIGLIAQVDALR